MAASGVEVAPRTAVAAAGVPRPQLNQWAAGAASLAGSSPGTTARVLPSAADLMTEVGFAVTLHSSIMSPVEMSLGEWIWTSFRKNKGEVRQLFYLHSG